MPNSELIGQQLRLRVRSPTQFRPDTLRTQNLGRGRLQRIAGQNKNTGEWATQSWRLNLSTYTSPHDAYTELNDLYRQHMITEPQLHEGRSIITHYWDKHE